MVVEIRRISSSYNYVGRAYDRDTRADVQGIPEFGRRGTAESDLDIPPGRVEQESHAKGVGRHVFRDAVKRGGFGGEGLEVRRGLKSSGCPGKSYREEHAERYCQSRHPSIRAHEQGERHGNGPEEGCCDADRKLGRRSSGNAGGKRGGGGRRGSRQGIHDQ